MDEFDAFRGLIAKGRSLIPRFKPYLGWGEFKEIFRHQSDSVRCFEEHFARTFEARHALAFPYGRSALWAFFRAFDLKRTEVILPAYTCVVVAHAIVLSGNVPRFVDVGPLDFNMDLDQVEQAINERTGAVIATHLFGYPLDVDRLNQIVRQAEVKYGKKIWIIQDCAHGFGTRWKGRPVCNEGTLALFGLNISKIITSIFGGMLTTQDRKTAQRLRQWREDHFLLSDGWRSIRRRAYLLVVYPAFQEKIYAVVNWLEEKTALLNYFTKAYHLDSTIHFPPDHLQQMSSVEAQVGMEQLKKFPEIVQRRRELARLYHAHLSDSQGIDLLPLAEGAIWSHFPVRVRKREEILRRLHQNGIQLGQLVDYSIPELPGYRPYAADASFPNAARCSRETINLPIHASLQPGQCQAIAWRFQAAVAKEVSIPIKTLLLVGNDKIGRRLIGRLGSYSDRIVLLDVSSGWKRVFRLLRKKRISLPLLCKMVWAEFRREDHRIPTLERIRNSQEFLQKIKDTGAKRVYLFRAGLIIPGGILTSGAEILNVHCASLHSYGGLGSIQRALEDEVWEQEATLHRVEASIDHGEVLRTVGYRLNPRWSYGQNEDWAYDAGIQLLLDELKAN